MTVFIRICNGVCMVVCIRVFVIIVTGDDVVIAIIVDLNLVASFVASVLVLNEIVVGIAVVVAADLIRCSDAALLMLMSLPLLFQWLT